MEKQLSPTAFVFAAFVFTLTLLGVSVVAPQDPYYRWQEHNSGTTRKADWIYERLHFDPEPIDVALIGTSRTGNGLSGPDIETAYCKATGRRIRVANLSIPETGRNMHYVIAKEAMRTKTPALTIVELNETESRTQHPGFVMLADAGDVLAAPLFVNFSYFADLARLPGRQATLWFNTLGRRAAVRPSFDSTSYQGHDLDRTRELPLIDGRVISRFIASSKSELDEAYGRRVRKLSRVIRLPSGFRRFEYRLSRLYLKKIEALADANSVGLAYAFIPAWREGRLPDEIKTVLEIDRPVIDLGGAIATDPGKWMDATHVNAWGAMEASARFSDELQRLYPRLGDVGCDAGD